ncbi:MAG: hypothetical protein PHE09_10450 [Oscillospiraceae bacterium]|nr:hypothetical protein [Oscillospiraceae bacterium]
MTYGVKKVEYTVYSNQGTPDVYFNGVYVGKISDGQLKVIRNKAAAPISVTLTGTTVPESYEWDANVISDVQLNVVGTLTGQYLGWYTQGQAGGYYVGNNTYIIGEVLEEANGANAYSARLRGSARIRRLLSGYSAVTTGTIPVGTLSLTMNYTPTQSPIYDYNESFEILAESSSGHGPTITSSTCVATSLYRTYTGFPTSVSSDKYVQFNGHYAGKDFSVLAFFVRAS